MAAGAISLAIYKLCQKKKNSENQEEKETVNLDVVTVGLSNIPRLHQPNPVMTTLDVLLWRSHRMSRTPLVKYPTTMTRLEVLIWRSHRMSRFIPRCGDVSCPSLESAINTCLCNNTGRPES